MSNEMVHAAVYMLFYASWLFSPMLIKYNYSCHDMLSLCFFPKFLLIFLFLFCFFFYHIANMTESYQKTTIIVDYCSVSFQMIFKLVNSWERSIFFLLYIDFTALVMLNRFF